MTYELLDKIICKEHISSGELAIWEQFRGKIIFRDKCKKCGCSYERYPTQEEIERYQKQMNTPMDI
jgi:hypothetical protein